MTSITKIFVYLFCACMFCSALTSCLGDGSNQVEIIVSGLQNATVKSFSFEDNSNVCKTLSGYTFTIDHFGTSDPELAKTVENAGIIFNPDSLPVGTVPDSIKVKVDAGKAAYIYFRHYDAAGNLKKAVNFADTQYIFFNDYAVTRLDITSSDLSYKKTYFVKVNVHKTYGDTIRWQYVAKDAIDAKALKAQKVCELNNGLYWFAEYNDSTIKVASSNVESIKTWSAQKDIVAEEKPEVSTIYNWNNQLLAVGKNGSLLSSTDGTDWKKVGSDVTFVNIIGAQLKAKNNNEFLHAIVKDNGDYKFATSENLTDWTILDKIPANFPIKYFSNAVLAKANPDKGNVTSRTTIVGGETADGTINSSSWSCDGKNWAEFEQSYLPAMKNPAIVEYTMDTDKPKSLWILWPGVLKDGSVQNTPYFSENKGVTWKLLSKEFAFAATTSPITAVGGVSCVMNPKNYWMYFIGGVDGNSNPQTNIFGGQLSKLTFDKLR